MQSVLSCKRSFGGQLIEMMYICRTADAVHLELQLIPQKLKALKVENSAEAKSFQKHFDHFSFEESCIKELSPPKKKSSTISVNGKILSLID